MSEWKEYKLGELVAINQRSISRKFDFEFIQYFDTSSVTENRFEPPLITKISEAPSRAKRLIADGDTIISTVRPIQKHFGFVKKSKPNQVVSTGFAVITPKCIEPRFLYYFLTQAEITEYLNTIAEGGTTTFPAFKAEELNELPISLPDYDTQTAIAEILSSLDDKIELNNKINQELEDLAQTLFKRWFIDFEFPNENGDPYKSSGGEMVDSELGEIPKGWGIDSLDNIADYLNGLALQKFPPDSETDFLPVIKIRELRQRNTTNSDKASSKIPEKYIILNGDVLFSWSGSLLVDFWTNGKGALNQHLFKVTSNRFPKWFYYLWTKHHLSEFIKIAESKATTMGHIQRQHLSGAKVLIPEVFDLITSIFEPLISNIIDTRIENNTLTTLRDTLLPKLISGELEVSQIQHLP